MSDELNLDDLLAQQQALEQKIKDARKEKKDQAIKDVVNIIKKYAITVKDLSGAFGYEPPTELKKHIPKTAKKQWKYVLDGVAYEWAGRGGEAVWPQTLKDYLKEKKITIAQFKADVKQHKIV